VSLVKDLQKMLKLVEADLRARTEDTTWGASLRAEYKAAFARGRTGLTWTEWRDGEVAQAGAAWVLATVFVRFCEDNHLLDGVWIAGPGERRRIALDDEAHFLSQDRSRGARSWLREAFGVLARTPPGRALLDPDHNPVWTADLGDGACRELLSFWREQDAAGALLRDLTDPKLDTRLLGDLYQDLSQFAKKKFALLQTPDFVEELILDRTLTPALEEFGLEKLRLIDPTCGSGHFLLGAFQRLLAAWSLEAPALDVRERVQRALDSIHGVDLNPFAVAIARFRLTTVALRAAGIQRLADAPAFRFHLAVGDSLIAGMYVHQGDLLEDATEGAATFQYAAEDISAHPGILDRGRYHVVVGNPPYITVKDKSLNEIYRGVYTTCKGKYALSAPFMELFFALAQRAEGQQPAGYIGQITSNSFMKREFGSKLVEVLLSGKSPSNPVDLLDVIDTSGAYIPGHGTPTVILIGRRRRPVASTVRTVLGIRGEPGQPTDPRRGLVWSEIIDHLDSPGFEGSFVSVTDLERSELADHPWSLSGGGAGNLKAVLERAADSHVGDRSSRIGFFGVMGADEAFMVPEHLARHLDEAAIRQLVVGEMVRDYRVQAVEPAFFPYDKQHDLHPLEAFPAFSRLLWALRTELGNRATFSKRTYFAEGRPWYQWHQLPTDVGAHPWAICFAFVATHNHFVLDKGGDAFGRSAPVIKLPSNATEEDFLDLLGLLNSSSACFWLKQVSYPKGGDPVGQDGARVSADGWDDRYEFTGTKLLEFPIPGMLPADRARHLDALATRTQLSSPESVVAQQPLSRRTLDSARETFEARRRQMVFEQEELDWEVYQAYGLTEEALTYRGHGIEQLELGTRAFEILLARRMAAGEERSAWFTRHGTTPVTALPAAWPQEFRDLVDRRLKAIEHDPHLRLLERPEYKRRWASESWESREQVALTSFILDRLETPALWRDPQGPRVLSAARLADLVRRDEQLTEALRLLTRQVDVALTPTLQRLLLEQAVPFTSAYRYTESGLRKRVEWAEVWDLQRREDAGETVTTPAPPKYGKDDFQRSEFWSARGKLDVPKERFILYPTAGQEGDTSEVFGWAGWDHAEQAQALARMVVERQAAAWGAQRIAPLLAGLVELQPWLDQWHADLDPRFGTSPSLAIRGLLEQFMAQLGLTVDDVRAWRPEPARRGRRAKS
jgi:hypothetical protein